MPKPPQDEQDEVEDENSYSNNNNNVNEIPLILSSPTAGIINTTSTQKVSSLSTLIFNIILIACIRYIHSMKLLYIL